MGIPFPHRHTTSTLATAPASSPLSQFGKDQRILKSSFDISKDNIMDMTSASAFVMSLRDEIYTEAMEDIPTLDFGLKEIRVEDYHGARVLFEELRYRIYELPLNTPVRRYLYGVVES
ncbi:hypothetical protein BGZ49_007446 [Haplosporangium sp. Z 27]|nr:hypothetical protein BGZ49_007446 [Haplosporangium sp. Z 27]